MPRNKIKNPDGTYKAEVVRSAIELFREKGLSAYKISDALKEKWGVKIPPTTIANWTRNYVASVLVETNRRVLQKLAEEPDAPLSAFIDPISGQILEFYNQYLQKIPPGVRGLKIVRDITAGLKDLAVAVEKIKGRARIEKKTDKKEEVFPGVMDEELNSKGS